jgi:hypothetical protein
VGAAGGGVDRGAGGGTRGAQAASSSSEVIHVFVMVSCSTKWALFLMSLKSLVETGKGAPSPGDVPISNWH